MKRIIVDPLLPGRYGKMTAEELDAEVARYDAPFVALKESKPLSAADRAVLRRARKKGGRPRVGEGANRVLITVERGLLRRADSYAKRKGMSRSELIARGLKSILGSAA
jgi:hypothetical protein